jgi:hypothetical protein
MFRNNIDGIIVCRLHFSDPLMLAYFVCFPCRLRQQLWLPFSLSISAMCRFAWLLLVSLLHLKQAFAQESFVFKSETGSYSQASNWLRNGFQTALTPNDDALVSVSLPGDYNVSVSSTTSCARSVTLGQQSGGGTQRMQVDGHFKMEKFKVHVSGSLRIGAAGR